MRIGTIAYGGIFLPDEIFVHMDLFAGEIHLHHPGRGGTYKDLIPLSDLPAVAEGKSGIENFRVIHGENISFFAERETGDAAFSLAFSFPAWERETYVFLPACAYDGNRYP